MKLQTHFSTGQRKKYALSLFLCLIFSFAAVSPAAAADLPGTLVPLGTTAGIRACAEGVTIAGLLDVETPEGVRHPAQDAGLLEGDRILSINGRSVSDTASMRAVIAEIGDVPLTLTILRGDETREVTLTPVKASDGNLRIGVWIRDAMLGIGTLTYYDPRTGRFGALGHGVTASSGDDLLNIDGSVLVPSSVRDVVRGQSGTPGELRGSFDESTVIGTVEKNTDAGIYGTYAASAQAEPMPLCPGCDVCEGAAQILSCVEGDTPQLYDIRILRVYGSERGNLRNMLIEVTDEALLARTGGIVQGISGSPIIQDGKLVGAVTHVLVNDPTRGYGIFIENMLEAAG